MITVPDMALTHLYTAEVLDAVTFYQKRREQALEAYKQGRGAEAADLLLEAIQKLEKTQ